MERAISPRKKPKSPGIDATANLNIKTSVTCTNVPEGLFDAAAAKKHFSKFGRVQRIRLFPKKQMCIIEYDQPISAERAVLNAGAYDGFMFDVGRTKARVRRRSKKDDDPDWVPDSDVEEELSAMSGGPTYRPNRLKPMEQESEPMKLKPIRKIVKQSPIRSKPPIREKKPIMAQPTSGRESPVPVTTTQTSLSNAEAAAELHQLRSRVSLSPDEQWRTLDARDRILRSWGGAGSRVKVGGATIGTCPDMCPEKELLHRQAEHQVMTLETQPDSDGQLEPWRAVKQYSRSSADQEIPMCYELRPAPVLMHTCLYLLHEIADTTRQVTLADWFHFMWDRFRGIRKDITQQALCCAESIRLVEICARFHAHCSARLADLEHTQFDQKLNTDNLTKCLQTLKHMYADVGPEMKPKEAEFRGYIALLNLGDANFWWEIKQLPLEIQKSQAITFAMQIFNALDNNNYVRFFRLIRDKATYLQACVLLRYFNDVRARALARIVKAYAPRGGSRYPAEELMNSLAFESVESMRSFINHYGLRFGKDESELIVILDRNQFIEDSDPYPLSRSIKLIESKRQSTVGEVIAGGLLPNYDEGHNIYSSFNKEGKLKEAALIAEEQGYNTFNDSNKSVKALKAEIQRLAQGGRVYANTERIEPKQNIFVKPEMRSPGKPRATFSVPKTESSESKLFSFNPAIPVAPTEIIHNSPEKLFGGDAKNIFSFSKPQDTSGGKDTGNLFKPTPGSLFGSKLVAENNLFGRINNENKDPFPTHNSTKRPDDTTNVFKSAVSGKSVFGQTGTDIKSDEPNKNSFGNIANRNIFATKEDTNTTSQNVFGNKNVFALAKEPSKNLEIATKSEPATNIFAAAATQNVMKTPPNLFGGVFVSKPSAIPTNLFTKPESGENPPKSFFAVNGDGSNKLSPGSLFKSAVNVDGKGYTIFSSKNKAPSVADNIFNSVNTPQNNIYDFNDNGEDEAEKQLQQQRLNDQRIMEETERQIQEKIRREEEERKRLEKLREEERRKQEEQRRLDEQKRLEELKRLEEKRRREEERKQEELRKKLEEERKAELKRLAEEEERKFKERVDQESEELIETLVDEIRDETVTKILKEETEMLKNLVAYANKVTDEICTDLCDDVSYSEMKAEKFLTEKLMKKWFFVWRKQLSKNTKRRCLLEDTPVWLPLKTPTEEANYLRRLVESAALKNMNAIHRGYKFNGELRQLPSAEPYNIMEIIKSPLLKRMKQINYPYDKCFFWKVTLVSPGEMKWLCRKVEVEKWLLEAFSDTKKHDTSESLIHVQKQSWNHLMDFVISVSLTNKHNKSTCGEAMEGSNGVLIYATENDNNLIQTIEETLKNKYPYQLIPVAIIMPKTEDLSMTNSLEQTLTNFMNKNIISSFKIILLDPENVFDSLNVATKRALKWLAKKYPQCPPLEIDYLKSICQRYLGNEIWYRLKSERDGRMNTILKDLHKLVKCYNAAVDKLTEVITNEDLFNYSSFPLEFKEYLDHSTPYPKPYEFIPTNARNSNNTSAIKDMMKKLKLPDPKSGFHPMSVITMQDQIRKYCNQIGWFENPEEVVCKVVAVLPNEFSDVTMSSEQFHQYFEHYDLLDFLNVMVYEKINQLHNFDNRFAIYERSVLENYRNSHWIYEIEAMSKMKHKALDSEDSLDFVIGAKRRKIELDSMEYLMLEDKDCTMVEENINANNESISRYSNCEEAVKQLEKQIDDERKKSMELENLLKSALCNV